MMCSLRANRCQKKDLRSGFPPLWSPLLAACSPVLIPLLVQQNKKFKRGQVAAEKENSRRIAGARGLELPPLEWMEIHVLIDFFAEPGFQGEPGVSYLIKTDHGSLLFDVGLGPSRPGIKHNARKMGVTWDGIDALAISHLHADHMGGLKAARQGSIGLPDFADAPSNIPCFLPARATAAPLKPDVIEAPRILAAGIGTTGPLARSLFFWGYLEEQILIANLNDRGLVVVTGCGHPGVRVIVEMASKVTKLPLYALAGGLHFPITQSRVKLAGLELQMFLGSGKPPWQRITKQELEQTITFMNQAKIQKVLVSGHDSCDESLAAIQAKLKADTDILRAGAVYSL